MRASQRIAGQRVTPFGWIVRGTQDRDGARVMFDEGVATQFIALTEWDWMRAFSARLQSRRALPSLAASTAGLLASPGGAAPLLTGTTLYPEWPYCLPLDKFKN